MRRSHRAQTKTRNIKYPLVWEFSKNNVLLDDQPEQNFKLDYLYSFPRYTSISFAASL